MNYSSKSENADTFYSNIVRLLLHVFSCTIFFSTLLTETAKVAYIDDIPVCFISTYLFSFTFLALSDIDIPWLSDNTITTKVIVTVQL